ncbi:MAG: Various polyols ABC transporter, permease protein 2, partial [uncultured Rubrobacteraceae bacterium]
DQDRRLAGEVGRPLRAPAPRAPLDARAGLLDGALFVQVARRRPLYHAGDSVRAHPRKLRRPGRRGQRPGELLPQQHAGRRYLDRHRHHPWDLRRLRPRPRRLPRQAPPGVLDHLDADGADRGHNPSALRRFYVLAPDQHDMGPDHRLPHVQPAVRDLDNARLLRGSAEGHGGGGDGGRRVQVPDLLARGAAANRPGHRHHGHTLPGLLLERLRLRRDVQRPEQPDASGGRIGPDHTDRGRLGPAHGHRYGRGAAHDRRRPRRQALPREGPDAGRGHRRI